MKIIACIIGLFLLSLSDTLLFAATNNEDIDNIELPPLSVFLESVYEHPSTLLHESYEDEAAALYKVEKRKWMDYLRVVGNYQFGYNSMYGENTNIIIPSVTNTAQHSYNVGVSLSIPIGSLASDKYRVLAQEQKIRQAEYEQEIALEQRRLIILDAYNRVTELRSVLRVKSESVALYEAQMKICENDYINGEMTIEALSLERSRRSDALVTYYEAKTALQSAVLLLEMLTNVKIIK